MIAYRNTRTGRVVDRDEPDKLMDHSKRWERIEDDPDAERIEIPAQGFDPSEHSVEDVLVHLDQADDDERRRVLVAERDGKARKSILSRGGTVD